MPKGPSIKTNMKTVIYKTSVLYHSKTHGAQRTEEIDEVRYNLRKQHVKENPHDPNIFVRAGTAMVLHHSSGGRRELISEQKITCSFIKKKNRVTRQGKSKQKTKK